MDSKVPMEFSSQRKILYLYYECILKYSCSNLSKLRQLCLTACAIVSAGHKATFA